MKNVQLASKCPNCGASLPTGEKETICPYCGSPLVLSDEREATGDACAQRGIEAHLSGEYSLAVEKLERALELGLTRYPITRIYTILGNVYNESKNPEKAIAAFQKALQVDPHYYKAWVGLGIAYKKTGNLEERERCYREALRIEPGYAHAHASLGALYIQKNEPEKAIAALEKALELNPTVAIAHANIALAYAMVGRFDEADAALRQATALGYRNYKTVQRRIAGLKELG